LPLELGDEGVADPVGVGLAGEAELGAVDAAGEDVVVARIGSWLDVAAVDANGGRAEKAMLSCGGFVFDADETEIGLDSELCGESLYEGTRGVVVRAGLEVEDLDERVVPPGRHPEPFSAWRRSAPDPLRIFAWHEIARQPYRRP
jgi:hypothetical protein